MGSLILRGCNKGRDCRFTEEVAVISHIHCSIMIKRSPVQYGMVMVKIKNVQTPMVKNNGIIHFTVTIPLFLQLSRIFRGCSTGRSRQGFRVQRHTAQVPWMLHSRSLFQSLLSVPRPACAMLSRFFYWESSSLLHKRWISGMFREHCAYTHQEQEHQALVAPAVFDSLDNHICSLPGT